MLSWVVKYRLQPRLARPCSPLRVSFLLLPTNLCPLTPIHSLLFSIHYALFCFPYLLTLLLSHSYENCRGVPNSSHYGTKHPMRMRVLSERSESIDLSYAVTCLECALTDRDGSKSFRIRSYTRLPGGVPSCFKNASHPTRHLSPFLSFSSALFCICSNHNCLSFQITPGATFQRSNFQTFKRFGLLLSLALSQKGESQPGP